MSRLPAKRRHRQIRKVNWRTAPRLPLRSVHDKTLTVWERYLSYRMVQDLFFDIITPYWMNQRDAQRRELMRHLGDDIWIAIQTKRKTPLKEPKVRLDVLQETIQDFERWDHYATPSAIAAMKILLADLRRHQIVRKKR